MCTQIALDAHQHALAKEKAAAMGVSMAEYVRRLVERDLDAPVTEADISDIFALGRSGGSDIAAERRTASPAAIAAHHETR